MADASKIKPEVNYKPSQKTLNVIGDTYADFYLFRNNRSGSLKHFQYKSFETVLKQSRELFWNSTITESEDLKGLGLDFSLPFVRKEVLDFIGRIVSMNIDPKIVGEGIGSHGVKVLHAMYKKWRFHNKEPVEKFWQLLYGAVNGTICVQYGWDGNEKSRRYLREYDTTSGQYRIEDKKTALWNDVTSTIVPLEEIYLSKIWQRDIQKQGKPIRMQEMTMSEFKAEFGSYTRSGLVVPGNQISEDSLFFQLLGGSGILTTDKIQVLRQVDTDNDEYKIIANGVWINPVGTDTTMPNPFHHKMQPYGWTIMEAIDEKFAYGLPMPFKLKDTHKLLNTTYTMLMERELRSIDPPVLTSDFEAPKLIFGQNRVIPVNDVDAYKELKLSDASPQFSNMQNSLQGMMSSFGQGGFSQAIPSRQPKAAREIIAMENMKVQALGNTLVMYYDLIYQEINLVLKTALQFYKTAKYANQVDNLVRAITVPNFALTQGGVGTLEVRIVKEPQSGLKLFFEAIKKSIDNGKTTEIIEIPVDSLQHLEFFIDDITLEPKKPTELEQSMFMENIIAPIAKIFVPAGVKIDMNKVFLRVLEKAQEHPQDYFADASMSEVMATWGGKTPPAPVQTGQQNGNIQQSLRGSVFGGQSNGGFPAPVGA